MSVAVVGSASSSRERLRAFPTLFVASDPTVCARASSALDQATNEMVAIKKMTNVFSHVGETKRTLREVTAAHAGAQRFCRRLRTNRPQPSTASMGHEI